MSTRHGIIITVFLDHYVNDHLSSITEPSTFHLFGVHFKSEETHLINIFGFKRILPHEKKPPCPPKSISLVGRALIKSDLFDSVRPASSSLYLLLQLESTVKIARIFYHNEICQRPVSSIILYDSSKLISSELFKVWPQTFPSDNICLQFLQNSLHLYIKRHPLIKRMSVTCPHPPSRPNLVKQIPQSEALNKSVLKIIESLNFSMTIQHLWHRSKQLFICTRLIRHGKVTFKTKNTLSSITFDVILGILLTLFITTFFDKSKWLNWGFNKMERLAENVEELIKILIAMPAGLKLNRPLNTALGTFFLYHIHIWKTYIVLLRPFLILTLDVLAFSGLFGASFMLALLSDLLSAATVHIYCFYGYAARLHGFQLSGLIALWRLFRGKKWNNLKRRVDSHQYGSDQLFIGSVCFTTLFFLSPTILLYYVVFFTLRIAILSIQLVIKFIIKCLVYFPTYGIVSWIFGAPCTLTHCKFSLIRTTENNLLVTFALQSMSFFQLFHNNQSHWDENFFNRKSSTNFFASLIKGNLL